MASNDPNSPARPGHRPRTKSVLSFGSHRSGDSGGKPKVDLTETARDKASRRMTSKADPTKAMSEMQPGQAAYDKSTMEPLRNLQHTDMHGNLITDPDASNPTRPRLERPLDTIRSFEAAVDGRYGKKLGARPGTSAAGYDSRRSSYYQGFSSPTPQPRILGSGGGGGGYGLGWGSHPAVRGDHGYGGGRMSRPESYVEGYNNNTPPPFRDGPPPRRMLPRNGSDPTLYGRHGANGMNGMNGMSGMNAMQGANGAHGNDAVYGNHHYYPSYDTATTASGSGNSHGTEPLTNSTDPSSENSSVDRIPQPPPKPKPDMGEQYGFSGFGTGPDLQQSPIMEEGAYSPPYGRQPQGQRYGQQQGYGYSNGHSAQGPNGYGRQQQRQQQQNDMPPPPPPHSANPAAGMRPRPPSKLQSSKRGSQYDNFGVPERQENGEKRKSWLKRRFSKNS